MFERFSESARQVVIVAEQEARDAGQRKIGTEHLLLGVFVEGEGLAAQALRLSGLTAEDVRDELRRHVQLREQVSKGQIPFSGRAKRAMELGLRESFRLGTKHVGPEHLLLGLTDVREGRACGVLTTLGAGPDAIRVSVSELMDVPVGPALVDRGRRFHWRQRFVGSSSAIG